MEAHAEWADAAGFGPVEEFPAGTPLFHQGHRPSAVGLIASGFVKTIRRERDDDALIALRGSGWLVAASAALLDRPYATSGVTATRCRLRSLPVATFLSHVRQSPDLAGPRNEA